MDSAARDSQQRLNNNGAYSGQWMEKPEGARSGKKKWLMIGGIIALIAVIAIAVGVGVSVSNNKKSSSSSSGSSSSGGGTKSDPNDPSKFEKDDRLKRSFWGLAYTPEGSLIPNCGNTLEQVIEDVQLMSQLTPRVRLYGSDCNQSALVLEAIKQTKVDLSVYLGIYNLPNDDHVAYKRQKDVVLDAIKTYGTDHIAGVTVGNEFMLNYLTAAAAQDPDSAIGNTGAAILQEDIEDFRSALDGLSLSKKLSVGNAEAGSFFNTRMLGVVDYGMSNVHAWFANVSAANAASWTNTFFQETNIAKAATLPNKPEMFIAETGWPSGSKDYTSNGPGTADMSSLQTFMDTFVCQANSANTGYFYFEMFDEKWKDEQFGGVEGYWGLFKQDRTLKEITIPDCVVS